MSQNLPSVIKVDAATFAIHRAFIEESVRYSYSTSFKYNSLPSSFDYEPFFDWLQTHDFYILNRNHKNIGCVAIIEGGVADESYINFALFLHPRVCKMAAISLLRGALCLSALRAISIKAESLSTYLYHGVMNATVRQVFPLNSRFTKITTSSQFCVVDLLGKNQDDLLKQFSQIFNANELKEYIDTV